MKPTIFNNFNDGERAKTYGSRGGSKTQAEYAYALIDGTYHKIDKLAAQLGISTDTVRGRLRYARHRKIPITMEWLTKDRKRSAT